MTDRYAVFGHPIAHSVSPALHRAFAEQTGQAMTYAKQAVEPDQFGTTVEAFFAEGGKGLNITLPFKRDAFNLAKQRTPRAQQAQAVNTLWQDANGTLNGDNTDGVGFIRDLTDNLNVMVQNQSVLLLGAGGAARGILEPLLEQSPAHLHIANRTAAKAAELAATCTENVTAGDLNNWPDIRFDLVINASAAGHAGDVVVPPADSLAAHFTAYDLSYGTAAEPFLAWARKQNAGRVNDGWGMLVEQAAEAFHIWRGVRPDTTVVIAQRGNFTGR